MINRGIDFRATALFLAFSIVANLGAADVAMAGSWGSSFYTSKSAFDCEAVPAPRGWYPRPISLKNVAMPLVAMVYRATAHATDFRYIPDLFSNSNFHPANDLLQPEKYIPYLPMPSSLLADAFWLVVSVSFVSFIISKVFKSSQRSNLRRAVLIGSLASLMGFHLWDRAQSNPHWERDPSTYQFAHQPSQGAANGEIVLDETDGGRRHFKLLNKWPRDSNEGYFQSMLGSWFVYYPYHTYLKVIFTPKSKDQDITRFHFDLYIRYREWMILASHHATPYVLNGEKNKNGKWQLSTDLRVLPFDGPSNAEITIDHQTGALTVTIPLGNIADLMAEADKNSGGSLNGVRVTRITADTPETPTTTKLQIFVPSAPRSSEFVPKPISEPVRYSSAFAHAA